MLFSEIFFALRFVFMSISFELSILSNVAIRTHFHFKTENKIQTTSELMYGCSNLSSFIRGLKGHVTIAALFLSYRVVNSKTYAFNFIKVVNEKYRQISFFIQAGFFIAKIRSEKKNAKTWANRNKKDLDIYFISNQIVPLALQKALKFYLHICNISEKGAWLICCL